MKNDLTSLSLCFTKFSDIFEQRQIFARFSEIFRKLKSHFNKNNNKLVGLCQIDFVVLLANNSSK
jgi:hypothetical protein